VTTRRDYVPRPRSSILKPTPSVARKKSPVSVFLGRGCGGTKCRGPVGVPALPSALNRRRGRSRVLEPSPKYFCCTRERPAPPPQVRLLIFFHAKRAPVGSAEEPARSAGAATACGRGRVAAPGSAALRTDDALSWRRARHRSPAAHSSAAAGDEREEHVDSSILAWTPVGSMAPRWGVRCSSKLKPTPSVARKKRGRPRPKRDQMGLSPSLSRKNACALRAHVEIINERTTAPEYGAVDHR
jgi:hypothetical protein